MIAAQGGIFGWVADSATLLVTQPGSTEQSSHGTRRTLRSMSPMRPPRPRCLWRAHDHRHREPVRFVSPSGRGDTNAFFGLGFNILVNVLVLTGLCIGVVHIPEHSVFHTILPALGIQLVLGNIYYTYLARRLAKKENRTDVTAMPYGPSVPHMFIVTFVIMLPIYLTTKNAFQAWEAGIAWAFVIGCIVLLGAIVGPYVRKYTPRAALLGTLAGVSLAFISMRPAGQMFEAAWIALPVMAIILVGFFTDVKMPGRNSGRPLRPAGGTAIAWIGGYMSAPDVSSAAKDIARRSARTSFPHAFSRLEGRLAAAGDRDPAGCLQLHRGMTNVESASVAGDRYGLSSVLLADGLGAIIGSCSRLTVSPGRLHRSPRLEEGRWAYRLLDGRRRRHRHLLFLGNVRSAGRPAADSGYRPDPAVHRHAHRCPGVPDQPRAVHAPAVDHRHHSEHRQLGAGSYGQCPGRGGTLPREGRV